MMKNDRSKIARTILTGFVLVTVMMITSGTNAFSLGSFHSGSEVLSMMTDDVAQSEKQSKTETTKADKSTEAKGKEAKCGTDCSGDCCKKAKSECKTKSECSTKKSECKTTEHKCTSECKH